MAKTKGAAETKVASDFEKIIHEGRERKKNEALAQRIFSKDRRQSAPVKTKIGAGPSLASRVGVKKRASLANTKAVPAGDINGDWTHDLHGTVSGGRGKPSPRTNSSLASRISAPGAIAGTAGGPKTKRAEKRAEQRAAQLANAVERAEAHPPSAGTPAGRGLSIRGLAGPFAVMAQNFAPGTTAADVESAMTPVGGEMVSCTVVKTSPMMLVEMVFGSKEGGEAVISTFNNQTADGRVIKVYPKPGGYKEPTTATQDPPRPRRGNTNSGGGNVVDGSHGFSNDLMDVNRAGAASSGRLYSDKLVGNSRRGRGGRGGRGGGGGGGR